jgi:hypothetical protein
MESGMADPLSDNRRLQVRRQLTWRGYNPGNPADEGVVGE